MRNIMIASALVFLAAWYVSTPLGNDGLWLSFLVFLAARGIGMHVYYRRAVLPAIAAT
jgi:MATE family multidrug resistance protein